MPLRQLPEHRAQLVLEGEHTGGEEVREGHAAAAQAEHVRDETRALHREDEPRRRRIPPPLEALRSLQRVERPVEFDRVEPCSGELEFPPLHEPRRVEDAAPGRVTPTGDPDPDGRRGDGHALTLANPRGFIAYLTRSCQPSPSTYSKIRLVSVWATAGCSARCSRRKSRRWDASAAATCSR